MYFDDFNDSYHISGIIFDDNIGNINDIIIPDDDFLRSITFPGFIRREINQGFTKIVKRD